MSTAANRKNIQNILARSLNFKLLCDETPILADTNLSVPVY